MSSTKTSLLTANLICAASMIIWAAGLPAADHLIPLMDPVPLTAMRMGLAALGILPLWAMLDGWAALRRAHWMRGIAVGSLLTLGAWLLILGQARGGAVTAAVISATLPLVGMSTEVALDGRKITAALILGLLLSMIGGVLAMDFGAGGVSLGFGALLCFVSVIAYTVCSRLTVTSFPQQTAIGRTAVTLVGAAICSIVIAAITLAWGGAGNLPDLSRWTATEWGAIAVYSVGGLAISQLLWIMSVGRLGIGASSLHVNAAPFYVMLILFALGGAWSWSLAAAAGLVGIGVLIAQGIIALPVRTRQT
jgi:drug/metabolite transporter (DMT)-like permease